MFSVLRIRMPEPEMAARTTELLTASFELGQRVAATDLGIAITVAEADDLKTHLSALRAIVEKLSDILNTNANSGVMAIFDLAVYADEYSGHIFTEIAFPPETLKLMAEVSIMLVLSIYGPLESIPMPGTLT